MSSRRNIKEVIAVVFAALSLLALAFSFWSVPPSVNKKLHSEIGRNIASEALKSLKPGGKISIITRDTDAFPQPELTILMNRLEQEIRRAGAEINTIQHLQRDPIRPNEVPSGDFYELLRRSREGDVIISLMGPPLLLPEHREKVGQPKAAVVALCHSGSAEATKIEGLLSAGLLKAAILNKPSATVAKGGLSFEQLYSVVRR